ncbi:MAG: GumC family protein [Bacteroidota bacterium]
MASHSYLPPAAWRETSPVESAEPLPHPELTSAPPSLAGILQRQWRVALVVCMVAFVVSTVFGLTLPKRYSAEAQISISPRETSLQTAVLQDAAGDEASMMTEMQILQSRWLMRRTVESLRRQSDVPAAAGEDWGDPVAGSLSKLQRAVGDWLPASAATEAEPPPTPELLLQSATARVAEHLAIGREAGARIIRIQYWSHDPKRAALVVNTLIAEYQQAQVDTKVSAARDLEQMLVEPLRGLQDKVRQSEEAVETYRQAHNFVDANESPVIARQILALTELQAQTRARRQEYQARVQTLDSGRAADSTPEAMESRLITELRQQQSTLTQTLTALSNQYSEDNPRVIDARNRLAEVDRKIAEETRRIANVLQRELAIHQQREAAIKADIEHQRQEYDKVNSAMVKMRELERDAQANRVLVTAFLERHKQMQVQGLVVNPAATVLARAVVPALPSFPRIPMVLGVCAALSIALGAAVAAAREYFRSGLLGVEDLELSQTQAAGIIPAVSRRLGPPADLVVSNPRSLYAEAFRKLLAATNLAGEAPPRSLLVTSSLPGEGKTTTLLSLARVAAHGNRRVVVVDCDLRNPRLHTCLPHRPQFGLADILEGRAQLADVIQRDSSDRIDVIPAGVARGELFELLSGEALARLIVTLSQTHDLVLVDSPPGAVVADARILAALTDAVLFCVHWGKTPAALAQSEMNTLLADGRTVGLVLSQVDMRRYAPYGRLIAQLYPAYQ